MNATVPLAAEETTGHNRWHPDLEPVAVVNSGQTLTIDTRNATDCQLTMTSTHEDLLSYDSGRAHPLTGPIYVRGAEPGDLLDVEIVAYEPAAFGVTAILPSGGLLGDLFSEPFLVKWHIVDGIARSLDLPGVAIRGAPFAGVMGVAPSKAFLLEVRRQEESLVARGHQLAPPKPESATPAHVAGGLRTIPPREFGGNMDARHLVAGSRLLLPVQVEGALFSVGDLHFAQGDGEVCGSGIEIAGAVTVRLRTRKLPRYCPALPVYEVPESLMKRSLGFTGIALTHGDYRELHGLDLEGACRRALLEMIEYLRQTRGLTREQAYVLASVAGNFHVSEAVNIPNALVTALLPMECLEDMNSLEGTGFD